MMKNAPSWAPRKNGLCREENSRRATSQIATSYTERATGFEPATSSLGSLIDAHGLRSSSEYLLQQTGIRCTLRSRTERKRQKNSAPLGTIGQHLVLPATLAYRAATDASARRLLVRGAP